MAYGCRATTMNGIWDYNRESCHICDTLCEPGHKSSLLHCFNFMLFEWNGYRKKIVKNRHGVEVNVSLIDIINGNGLRYSEEPKKGKCITKATVDQARFQNNGITYQFVVKNVQSSNSIFIMNAILLHPYESFVIEDTDGKLQENLIPELEPGAMYSFKVVFKPKSVINGSYKMPMSIQFQTTKGDSFSISREMVIVISDEKEVTVECKGKSPFTSAIWTGIQKWIDPVKRTFGNDLYVIPKDCRIILKMGLSDFPGMTYEDIAILHTVKNRLLPNYPTLENYRDFFHYILWLDEMGSELMLQRYNMENVTMKHLPNKVLELIVPGLAEKRPSLIVGDIVNIRVHEDHTAYKGIISRVNDLTIWIAGVSPELEGYIKECPDLELDVAFQLGRLPYQRMHAGIDQCASNGMLECLFPEHSLHQHQRITTSNQMSITDDEFFNKGVVCNVEQRRAVESILNCRSDTAPYIVFGPPGTGKTITIVEAILQIKKRIRNAKILVCAPANAACDMLTQKLIQHNITKDELIRVHSESRDWSSVPEDVKPYSNYCEKNFTKPTGSELMNFHIVITTLILSGRYAVNQKFHPDFVFIDEAAQAMEPEAAVAVALLKLGKQLVLAGDPKQLGPQCSSAVAEKYKLNVSLLERLMNTEMYTSDNPNFIAMLKLNFRAHPVVLELPNKLFYDNQLRAVSRFALHDPITNVFIYHKIAPPKQNWKKKLMLPQPVEFCAIFAKERREGRAPSYFNQSEIEMVLKYVKALTSLTETKVTPTDIGIVTPYIRQVYRIKDRLKYFGFSEVEVGTTEVFQGREKRIIIISTVRAQHSLLLHDRRYKLGFIKNEKRFNVALTRAISKLIIIGCPNVLRYDDNWLKYIDFCEERGAYFGAKFDRRTDDVKNEVINRMKKIHLTDPQYKS